MGKFLMTLFCRCSRSFSWKIVNFFSHLCKQHLSLTALREVKLFSLLPVESNPLMMQQCFLGTVAPFAQIGTCFPSAPEGYGVGERKTA